jgi:hypothetical protein
MDIALIKKHLPHTLRGAYNYKNIGCCINISLLFMHNAFIYPYKRLTCLGILADLIESSLSMIVSIFMSNFLSI